MLRKIIFLCFGLFFVLSCQNDEAENSRNEKSVEEIRTGGGISDIIRNPISSDKPLDTINVAKMVFKETTYDYGRVKQGDVVSHTFKFRNEGLVPLLITNARSTCGCTVPKWPEEPIEPGEDGEIKVRFNTAGKKNQNNKPVYITANTYPTETKIYLAGWVED